MRPLQTWKLHGRRLQVDNLTDGRRTAVEDNGGSYEPRINRDWRPKDEDETPEKQQDCEQEQDKDQDGQQDQDGGQNQDGGNQPQQGDGGQQGQSGQGGQQGQQGQQGSGGESGQGGSEGGGAPAPSKMGGSQQKANPTAKDYQKAQQEAQEAKDKFAKREARIAQNHNMSLSEWREQYKGATAKKKKKSFQERLKSLKRSIEWAASEYGYYDEEGQYQEVDLKKTDNPEKAAKQVYEAMEKAEKDTGDKKATAEELEEDSAIYKTQLNKEASKSVFDPMTGESLRKLNNSFAVLASKIAEDAVSWPTIGDDEWDIPALMRRKYDKRPLSHCKQSREKSRLVLILDTSPSCKMYAEFFALIASAASAFGDVEIYDAPNARIEHKFIPGEGWFSTSGARRYDWGLDGRHVIFFGDWDGSGIVIHNSRNCKLYWFDCDNRMNNEEKEDQVHNFGYTLQHFKGKKFDCFNSTDFIRLVRKIK